MPAKTKVTRERYDERIRIALAYIHEHLTASLDLQAVAEASHFSPFHFHRIFLALVGETVNDYIRRKRLELSVCMLVYNEEKTITDIAHYCGFSSSSNFSKAFSGYFGCSPREVRSPEKFKDNSKIGELKRKHGKDFDPRKLYPDLIHQEKEINMDVQVIDMNEQRVCYMTSSGGYDEAQIHQAWDKMLEWLENNKVVDANYYGLCYDNPVVTPQDKCRYDAVVSVPGDIVIAAPFKEGKIPAGKYAMAYYRGPADPDAKLHLKIYREWFPQSGFDPDDYPLLERYLNDEREDGFVEMQILIKLKD